MSNEATQSNMHGLLAYAHRKAEVTQQRVHQAIDQLLREQQIVFQEAVTIAEEQQKKGVKLNWPPGKSLDNATELADFPEPIAEQAQKNWEEQTPRMKEVQKNIGQIAQAGKAFVIGVAFVGSFGFFDLIWFFLAMGSAFRLGRGITD